MYVYDVSSMVYGVVTSMSSHDKNLIAKLLKDYSIRIVITNRNMQLHSVTYGLSTVIYYRQIISIQDTR